MSILRTMSVALVVLTGMPTIAIANGPSEVYRIGPEDILQVAVWNNEAMSRTVPVHPEGMLSLPLINDVKAQGLTPSPTPQQENFYLQAGNIVLVP